MKKSLKLVVLGCASALVVLNAAGCGGNQSGDAGAGSGIKSQAEAEARYKGKQTGPPQQK